MKKLPVQFITASIAASALTLSFVGVSFAQTTTPASTIAPTEATSPSTSTSTPPGKSAGRTPNTIRSMEKPAVDGQMNAKKQMFMEKLAKFQNTQKKTLVEKIDTKMSDVNQRRTTQMTKALETMNNILTNLITKAELAKSQGQDTTKLNLAISSAQTAVKAAEAAVTTQSTKEYVPTITTETTVKTTVGSVARTLQTDLRSTHTLVIAAKQKVVQAVVELKQLKSTEKQASGSASNEE